MDEIIEKEIECKLSALAAQCDTIKTTDKTYASLISQSIIGMCRTYGCRRIEQMMYSHPEWAKSIDRMLTV